MATPIVDPTADLANERDAQILTIQLALSPTLLDAVLAMLALALFPLVCFYGHRHVKSSVTFSSMLVAAYLMHVLLTEFGADVSTLNHLLLVLVAALAVFVVVFFVTQLGLFVVGGVASVLTLAFYDLLYTSPDLAIATGLHAHLKLWILSAIFVVALLASLDWWLLTIIVTSFVGAYMPALGLSVALKAYGVVPLSPVDPHGLYLLFRDPPSYWVSLNGGGDSSAPPATSYLWYLDILLAVWALFFLGGLIAQLRYCCGYTDHHTHVKYEPLPTTSASSVGAPGYYAATESSSAAATTAAARPHPRFPPAASAAADPRRDPNTRYGLISSSSR